jgi:hypothetical protein
MLSNGSSGKVVEQLKRIAREVSEAHNDDMRLPLEQRSAMSLLVAFRHWELEAFAELRRRPQQAARIVSPRRGTP